MNNNMLERVFMCVHVCVCVLKFNDATPQPLVSHTLTHIQTNSHTLSHTLIPTHLSGGFWNWAGTWNQCSKQLLFSPASSNPFPMNIFTSPSSPSFSIVSSSSSVAHYHLPPSLPPPSLSQVRLFSPRASAKMWHHSNQTFDLRQRTPVSPDWGEKKIPDHNIIIFIFTAAVGLFFKSVFFFLILKSVLFRRSQIMNQDYGGLRQTLLYFKRTVIQVFVILYIFNCRT